MKYLVYAALAAVLAFFGWRIYEKLTEPEMPGNPRQGARAVPVAVAPVRQKTILDAVEFTGSLEPVSRFTVAPKVSGRLERLLVNIGDPVNSGDLIAVLDDEEYKIQMDEARAELEVSKATQAEAARNREVALREVNRLRELFRQEVISASELDTAEAAYNAALAKHEVAQALVAQREAALRAAQVRHSYTQIQVAWEGNHGPRFIAERFVDEGALLSPNNDIVSVVDLDPILAVIYAIESDIPKIQIGQPASLTTDAFGARRFEGRIIRRAPVVREESRQARVEIEIPNPGHLLAPGMFARVRIQFDEKPNATVVPLTALATRDGKQGVFMADMQEKKARFVPVKLGIRDSADAQVLEPALQGMVVTLGQHLLEDGAAIALPDDSPKKGSPKP